MMQKLFCLLILFSCSFSLFAQPSAIPAPGYYWAKTGTSSYTSGPLSTIPGITSGNTAYGAAGDSDPSSCAAFCSGNCDGATTFGVSLFGAAGYAAGTASNCEQRAVVLTQWNNAKPNSGVANGAVAGTVYLPVSAAVTVYRSPAPLTAGTGAGSETNHGKLFGGAGAGNTTQVNITNNYSISWMATAFSGAVSGTQSWSAAGSFTENDPGGSGYSTYRDWYTGSFGNTIATDNVTDIPVNAISQTGGNFEVVFGAATTLNITRSFGNADAFIESNPGMEGRAAYTVNYDIWQLVQVVPLKLSAFSAEKLNTKALLRWTNQTEINNLNYMVERSSDALHWAGRVTMTAQNTNGSPAEYQYTDDISDADNKNI